MQVPSPAGGIGGVLRTLFLPHKAKSLYCWWKSKFYTSRSNTFQNVKWLLTLELVLIYYHKERTTVTIGISYLTAVLFSHHWCHVALRYRLQPKVNVPYCMELDIYWVRNPCWYWGSYFLLNLFDNLNLPQFFFGGGGGYSKSKYILLIIFCLNPLLQSWPCPHYLKHTSVTPGLVVYAQYHSAADGITKSSSIMGTPLHNI